MVGAPVVSGEHGREGKSMVTEPRLHDLLDRWEAFRSRGVELSVEELCKDAPELIPQVKAHLNACQWLPNTGSASHEGADLESGASPRSSIGRYRLRRLVGQGGFGEVWEAFDPELDRVVAVKIPKTARGGDRLESFLEEARKSAKLRHAGCVPIFDVGRDGDSIYIVSELVEGESLADRLERGPIPVDEAASIVSRVAQALAAAHAIGIIHRDIKPSNILLRRDGAVFLTDFGMAAMRAELKRRRNVHGGTLAYMSPEQVKGKGREIDARSDLFSLGIVLYEMTTGKHPFHDGSNAALLRRIVEADFQRPSAVNRSIEKRLERVIMKALSKHRPSRYRSALEFADALQEAMSPVSRRRYAWLLAAAGFFAVTVITSVELAKRQMIPVVVDRREPALPTPAPPPGKRIDGIQEPSPARDLVPASQDKSPASPKEGASVHPGDFKAADPDRGSIKKNGAPKGEQQPLAVLVPNTNPPSNPKPVNKPIAMPEQKASKDNNGTDDVKSAPVRKIAVMRPIRTFVGHHGLVSGVAFSHDGKQAASSSWDRTLKLWDVATGQEIRTFLGHSQGIGAVAFFPNDRWIVSGAGHEHMDPTARIWDVRTGKETCRLVGHTHNIMAVAVFPNGQRVLSASLDNTIRIWNPFTGAILRALGPVSQPNDKNWSGQVWSVAVSRSGRRVLAGVRDGAVRYFDSLSGDQLATFVGHRGWVFGVAFSPNDETAASVDGVHHKGDIRLWNLKTRKAIKTIEPRAGSLNCVVFTPSGNSVLIGGSDGSLLEVDSATGETTTTFEGHTGAVKALAISSQGQLLSGGEDSVIRLWSLPAP